MKKVLIGVTILLSFNLYAQGVKTTGTKPVDEGDKLVHQEDTTKGSKDVDNSYQYKEESLAKMKSSLTIRRKDISHSPFKLLKYNDKSKKLTRVATEEKALNSVNFNIKTSTLKVGDRLLVINDKDSNLDNSPKGKEVIIEIEIIK